MNKTKGRSKDSTPREAITNAAIKLFGQRGYNGTTMRDVAEEVGILAGSLYAHIDSKESLLAEMVQTGIQHFLEIARGLEASDGSPAEKMRTAIVAHVGVVAENPMRSLVVFHQWRFLSEPNRMKAVTMRRRYAQTFMKIIDDGIACGEFNPKLVPRIATFGILGALNWTPEWYSPEGPSTPEAIGNQLADALIGGLRRDGETALETKPGAKIGTKAGAARTRGKPAVAVKPPAAKRAPPKPRAAR